MKKIFYLLTLIIFASACGKDEKTEPYLKYMKIYENVYKFGKPDLASLHERHEFDRNGSIIQTDCYYLYSSIDNKLHKSWTYKYDNNGKLTEKYNTEERITYTYNERGSIYKEQIYVKSGISVIFTYTYDEQGRTIKKEEDRIILTFDYYSLYSYSGNIVIEKKYNTQDSTLFYTIEYEYDANQKLVRQTEISPKGLTNDTYISKYTYNSDNTVAEQITYGLYGEKAAITYTYSYNPDKTINNIHKLQSLPAKESDLKFYYEFAD